MFRHGIGQDCIIENLVELDFNCRLLTADRNGGIKKQDTRGGRTNDDLSEDRCHKICNALVQEMLKKLGQRFSDEVSQLCEQWRREGVGRPGAEEMLAPPSLQINVSLPSLPTGSGRARPLHVFWCISGKLSAYFVCDVFNSYKACM